jgi:isocitrate dehydrogenase
MQYDHIAIPADGEVIKANPDHSLLVPDYPILPYIEGDGIGVDVTPVMQHVVNAAVTRAYGERRSIRWMQVYAGQAATEIYGDDDYLPEETLHALRNFIVSIKGPLTTPTGGGIRSLNVAIRAKARSALFARPFSFVLSATRARSLSCTRAIS